MDASVAQYKGKVVLVNFWATWCQPCRVEIPWLIEFNQRYGPKGLVILGVAMDDEGKKVVEPFVNNQIFQVNGHPGDDGLQDCLGQRQRCGQIWRAAGLADEHAVRDATGRR